MNDSGVFLPLRLYDSIGDTVAGRGECDGFKSYEFFCCPTDHLLPFQISSAASIPASSAVLKGCGQEIGVTAATSQEGVEIDGEDVYFRTFPGGTITAIPQGIYQLHYGSYVSDPIFFTDEADEMPRITYRGRGVQGGIYFPDGFLAECFINSYIEKPEYPIINETRQDGEGNEHHVFQRWEKRRKIIFKGVESMMDAMSLLPLMEEVYINDERVYDVNPMIMWEDEYGCLANIELSFLTRRAVRSF